MSSVSSRTQSLFELTLISKQITECCFLSSDFDFWHRFHLLFVADHYHCNSAIDNQEVEEYLEHVWKLSNDRLKQLETENKSLKKQSLINCNNNSNSNESKVKGNAINGNQLKQNSVDNLCDSLKLKSSLKQIIQK